MKLLFLDIDGVLSSGSYILRIEEQFDLVENQIDQDAVSLLNKITDATGAAIVVSSTWRLSFLDLPSGLLKIQKFLKSYGITGSVIGMTPYKMNAIRNQRGKEIQQWLNDNADTFPEGIEKFVIIDDDADMGRLKTHLVQTEFKNGLQENHVMEIIERLK